MPPPFPWRYPYQRDAPRLREVLRPLVSGETVEARFVPARMRLQHPDGDDDDFVEWDMEIGGVDRWRAPWPVLLGQDNFLSRFTVSMHRGAATVIVEDWDAFDQRFGVESGERDEPPSRFDP